MAGYIMTMSKYELIENCIEMGVYSTYIHLKNVGLWLTHHEGTYADYLGMKSGDKLYFFCERKLYGIGELTEINNLDCKFLNYPNALLPQNQRYKDIKEEMLISKSEENLENRVLCSFKPSPAFFKEGIDMDDVLASNPDKFKMLRALWKLSFVKVDDEENKALFDIIIKRNEANLDLRNSFIFNSNYKFNHEKIGNKINENYLVNSKMLIDICSKNDFINHEMAIEANIVERLSKTNNSVFGEWDYISHQVIASPFKAIDYMDKMDVFGYKYIKNYNVISKYLVIEIKKGVATVDVVDQTMKYVDWINQEYANGDYNMIEAFIVAYDFPVEVIERRNDICERNFLKGRRPTVSEKWTNLRLIKYRYNSLDKEIIYDEID